MLLLCRLWRSERWLPFLASMLGGTLRLPWTTVAVKMSLSRWGAAVRECRCLPGYCSQPWLKAMACCDSNPVIAQWLVIGLDLLYLHTSWPGHYAWIASISSKVPGSGGLLQVILSECLLCNRRAQYCMHCQAPEDGTDVVTSAKRLLTSPGLNALGLKDRRDITRLVAQSALQVSP